MLRRPSIIITTNENTTNQSDNRGSHIRNDYNKMQKPQKINHTTHNTNNNNHNSNVMIRIVIILNVLMNTIITRTLVMRIRRVIRVSLMILVMTVVLRRSRIRAKMITIIRTIMTIYKNKNNHTTTDRNTAADTGATSTTAT